MQFCTGAAGLPGRFSEGFCLRRVHRGGMTVEAVGLDDRGHPVKGLWWLVAEAGDGPFVPTLPALAAVRALADGRLKVAGATACVGVLSLKDIETEFERHRIGSFIRFEAPPASLYERVLGTDFDQLPEAVRRMHRPGWGTRSRGEASVQGPDTLIARAIAAVAGFPRAAKRVAVVVEMTPEGLGERWVRQFGSQRFESVLSAGDGQRRLVERFGLLSFDLDLVVSARGVLGMPVRSWRLGWVPMPSALAPVSIARECVDEDGRFCFDVELRLPFGLGRLVRYRGWLESDGLTERRKVTRSVAGSSP